LGAWGAKAMPPDFFLEQRFGFWTPWKVTAEEASARESRFSGIGRLKRGLTIGQARTELQEAFRNLAPDDLKKGWKIRLMPLAEHLTATAGIVLGVAAAFALTRLIAAQLYQTETTDLLPFAGAPLLLLLVALLAAYVPARRAVGVDPLVACVAIEATPESFPYEPPGTIQ
jgi:hypothetical protein